MRIFDLHCDTLYRAKNEKASVADNGFEFSFKKAAEYAGYTQVTAVWIPDEYRGESAFRLFDDCCKLINRELNENPCGFHKAENAEELKKSSHNIILSVEGGAVLGGDLNRVELLKKRGVRFITITWNGSNEIGDGILCENPKGLSSFGKELIPVLEENNIIVDISHASEPLFYDVAQLAKKPFVATHSNSRKYCSNKRNLTDEQFRYICKSGGIVGLNFHRYFLKDDGNAGFSDIEKHMEHFLSLGGEDNIALGSDFDGAEMPYCIKGVENMADLYGYFLSRNYSEELIRKIFFDNAERFFKSYDMM